MSGEGAFLGEDAPLIVGASFQGGEEGVNVGGAGQGRRS